jgi:arginine-tRNA-protein transferase
MRSRFENTFVAWTVPPAAMDELWAGAWWFLGTTFFRQCVLPWNGRMEPLLHLRIRMDQSEFSKSQARVLRRNTDLRVQIQPAKVGPEQRELFHRHKQRFFDGIPESLDDFLGPAPESHPVPILEFGIFEGSRLLAASYLARGQNSVASLYGIFNPSDAHRSLGTLTMLLELNFARQQGCEFYYPGYTLENPSPMDYKKRFLGLEAYAWDLGWEPFKRHTLPHAEPAPTPLRGSLNVDATGQSVRPGFARRKTVV